MASATTATIINTSQLVGIVISSFIFLVIVTSVILCVMKKKNIG